MSSASKVLGRSVVMAWAAMWTSARRPCFLAKSSETSTAAAAPQVGGHAIRRVITPGQIAGASSTSCSLTSLRNSASGLFDGVAAGLGADAGEGVQRRAVLFHVRQAGAAEVAQRQRDLGLADQAVGDGVEIVEGRRTVGEHATPARRGSSARSPSTSTQSAAPLCTAWRARYSAVEPVEQLLLTLTIGMPVMPTPYSAFWPQVESP